MSRLRVLLLTTGVLPSVGGPFESVSGLARGLAEDPSTEVTVVACTSKCEGWQEHADRWGAAALRVFTGNPVERLGRARRYLHDRLGARAVDIIHASGLWDETTILTSAVYTRSEVPVVWSVRGMLEPWALDHHRGRKRLAWLAGQRSALQQAAVVHATADSEAAACRQAGLQQPIAVIPNGIQITPPRSACPISSRERRRCVYLGRLHAKKGLATLIEAWRCCATHDWELEIAGPDADGHAAMLESLVQRYSLANVRVTGPRYGDERRRFLEGCELFICPSFSENFGNAIAEAMERSKPVITTTGTPWGVLAKERMGWWVQPTVEGLSCALGEAMGSSPEKLQSMGARCRQFVEASLSWAGVVGRTRSVYEWLMGGQRPACIVTESELAHGEQRVVAQ